MRHETFTLTRDEFKRMQRDMRSFEKRVSNTEIRRRAIRRSDAGAGAGGFRWALTPIAGIPAANFDPTGGSDSLGLLTPAQATCSIIETNSDAPPTYEIRTGNDEVIFNGVQSAIAAETIIGIERHRDGNWFVIVEDCPPIEGCPPCVQVPARVIHAIIGSVTSGTCSTPECNAIQDTFGLFLNTQCGWSSVAPTLACVGDFLVQFQIADIGGGDVSLRLQLSTTGPPAEQAIWEITPVDLTTIDCSTGTIANFAAGNLVSNTWTLCDITAATIEIIMSPAP